MKDVRYYRLDIPSFFIYEDFFDIVYYYLEENGENYEIDEIEEGIFSIIADKSVDLSEIKEDLTLRDVPYDYYTYFFNSEPNVISFRPEKIDGYIEVDRLRTLLELPSNEIKKNLEEFINNPIKKNKPLKDYNF